MLFSFQVPRRFLTLEQRFERGARPCHKRVWQKLHRISKLISLFNRSSKIWNLLWSSENYFIIRFFWLLIFFKKRPYLSFAENSNRKFSEFNFQRILKDRHKYTGSNGPVYVIPSSEISTPTVMPFHLLCTYWNVCKEFHLSLIHISEPTRPY